MSKTILSFASDDETDNLKHEVIYDWSIQHHHQRTNTQTVLDACKRHLSDMLNDTQFRPNHRRPITLKWCLFHPLYSLADSCIA